MTNFKSLTRIAAISLALAAGLLAMTPEAALAQTNGTWSATTGGSWGDPELDLQASIWASLRPAHGHIVIAFRVASVPEPSTYALLLMTGAGALWLARRRR
jgi:hypothetical protein